MDTPTTENTDLPIWETRQDGVKLLYLVFEQKHGVFGQAVPSLNMA